MKQLAKETGILTQQIQKYEEAGNRVSVSMLYLICEALGMSIPEFFEEFYGKRKKSRIVEMVESKDGAKLVVLFLKMSANNRKHFIRFGKIFVEEGLEEGWNDGRN